MSAFRQLLCVLFLALTAASCSTGHPLAQAGRLDLTSWDFGANPTVRLDGEWDRWWNREVLGDEGPGSPGFGRAHLPGFWTSSEGGSFPAVGAMTYRLVVQLPPGGGPWSLQLPETATAWRLSVGGHEVAGLGRPSADPGVYLPSVRPRVVDLPLGADTYDLRLYVVNQADRIGGLRDSVLLGPRHEIQGRYLFSQLDSAFFFGGLAVMALFNLIIFSLQRQRMANLWLALFSLFVAVRSIFSGPRIIHDLWPQLSFDFVAHAVFFCILGAVVSFILYMRYLFREWWPTRIFVPFLFFTGLFAVLLFILPVKDYAEVFFVLYDLPLALMVVVFLSIAIWATIKRHEDGLLVLCGMLVLVAGALNDIIYQTMPLPQGDILGRLLFLFLVLNTYLLSRQLSKDYALTLKQAEELRRVDEMKDAFLARVTHELRTPLTGTLGIIDSFRQGDFGPVNDRQGYHLSLLEASDRRLLSMVNSILDFSHLRRHQMVAEARPISLQQTVDFLLPSFYPSVKPGVALVNRISPDLPLALGDEIRLQQALHHLLKNALQHTEGGTVAVEAEQSDTELVLSIRDTGCGIPEDRLGLLFSPFEQLDDVDTRVHGGLGLGLALSQQLLKQMGGRLELKSKEGVGTTVKLWIPVCPPSKAQYFQALRVERMLRWEDGVYEPPLPPAPPVEAGTEEGLPAGTLTVLVVDDEATNRAALRSSLKRYGFRVLEAPDGPTALELVTKEVVDLMILDIMMPGMSGFEVCTRIRLRLSRARLPILFWTAKSDLGDFLKGFEAGANDYLVKPTPPMELKARLDLHLSMSRAARTGQAFPPGP